MNKRVTARCNMVKTVLGYLTENAGETASLTQLAGVRSTADNKLVLIDQMHQLTLSGSTGTTLDTEALRVAMQNIALKVGNALSAFASATQNFTLRAKVRYSETKLNRKKKGEVANICQDIYEQGVANLGTAIGYGYGIRHERFGYRDFL